MQIQSKQPWQSKGASGEASGFKVLLHSVWQTGNKDDHKSHQTLDDKGWCDQFISCYCSACHVTDTPSGYDLHLEQEHKLMRTTGKGKWTRK